MKQTINQLKKNALAKYGLLTLFCFFLLSLFFPYAQKVSASSPIVFTSVSGWRILIMAPELWLFFALTLLFFLLNPKNRTFSVVISLLLLLSAVTLAGTAFWPSLKNYGLAETLTTIVKALIYGKIGYISSTLLSFLIAFFAIANVIPRKEFFAS